MNVAILAMAVLLAQPSKSETCVREGMSDYQEFDLHNENGEWYAHGATETKWATVELRQHSERARIDYWAFIGTYHHQREYWDHYNSECGEEYEPADNTVITCYPVHGKPFTVEYQCDATEKLVELYKKWKNDK